MKKGSRFTEEQRRKISESRKGKDLGNFHGFKKGHSSWNKGTKGVMKPNRTSFKRGDIAFIHTESSKEKIRLARTGVKRPEIAGANCYMWKGGISQRPGYGGLKSAERKIRLRGNGGTHTLDEWIALKAFYNHKCLACGRSEAVIELTKDHVIPIVAGGTNSIENLQPLCRSCNSSKKTKTIDYRSSLGAKLTT